MYLKKVQLYNCGSRQNMIYFSRERKPVSRQWDIVLLLAQPMDPEHLISPRVCFSV